jgi:TM2 domain-containing membrane protein YozV
MTETYAGAPAATATSPKSLLAATLLCFFLGGLGIHRFYTGKVGTGIAMIFTLGGLGIWALVDFIMLVCGAFKDKEGLPLKWQ